MQEEVTQKTIALSVKTARVTADVLKNMLRKYLSGQQQKGRNPYKVGKQSYKELKSQGSGLSNIEITDGNIKSFERVAKKYRLDFALKKDSSTKPPTYYVFFKGQDTEMMNLAFKKYLGVQMNKKDKPSVMKKLMHFKDGSLHRNYLKDYKGGLYSYLTLTGELWTYLADLNEQCVEYRDFLMNQIMEQEGITEELKSRDQMEWVRRANNVRSRVDEIILNELVYV